MACSSSHIPRAALRATAAAQAGAGQDKTPRGKGKTGIKRARRQPVSAPAPFPAVDSHRTAVTPSPGRGAVHPTAAVLSRRLPPQIGMAGGRRWRSSRCAARSCGR
eukprot:scaffold2351_cov403-Prasinococcus_capsulatus_cf.AAC.15